MENITITNVGPIARLTIPVPEGGGVVVLRGRNGIGKTRAIQAVESALSGRGDVSVRDGALAGEVRAFGVKLNVGRRVGRSGELEVESLEGRLSIAELVDPGLKSPEAADARRIKALVQLSGEKPAASLFYQIAGGREALEQVVSTATLASDDLVQMAERIKRDFEAAARTSESQVEHHEGRARGARESAAGIDLSRESNQDILQAAVTASVRREAELTAAAAYAERDAKQRESARRELEAARAKYKGPSAREAAEAAASAGAAYSTAAAALQAAQEEFDRTSNLRGEAFRQLQEAERHQELCAKWEATLMTNAPELVSPERLQIASQAVQEAQAAAEHGALVRKAREALDKAETYANQAANAGSRALALRAVAAATDEVLSGLVARSGSSLRVQAGRLVLDTPARGETYFAELSHGERWRLATEVGVRAVGTHGVLTIPQEAWEGLDPQNRGAIANIAADHGVVILTAEASEESDVVAEVFA